ncbi:unnamed protein product [Sphenostylis stenocarpa]|uniref:CID domain-containing protein n=1 Tax=Sphenostylis stenocarpa TaxID=92480 RepID=A0AA86V3D2_9FABA|nr:unnamed protein product [Sphenostylis stenocarpa]
MKQRLKKQSLSNWCISHRERAREIVETWDKLFNASQKERRLSFLYLANDILQNSKRNGSEFVNEFWKVLPAALRHVYESGDELRRLAVGRLNEYTELKGIAQNVKTVQLLLSIAFVNGACSVSSYLIPFGDALTTLPFFFEQNAFDCPFLVNEEK